VVARYRERWSVGAETYTRIALAALVLLTLIVFTGAAVRLTGSGLGCPTWPKCTDSSFHSELNSHGLIEFGNRVLTFFVSVGAIAAALFVFLRRPLDDRRRDLEVLAILLPVGVIAQAVVGGLSVLYKLAPGWVMAHYVISAAILIAAFELWWRSARSPEELSSLSSDRTLVLLVRGLTVLAAVAIFIGTASTAAGPHAGASGTGEFVHRLDFWGGETLRRLIHLHGYLVTVLGVGTVAAWWLARRRGANRELVLTLMLTCLLLLAQGVVGITQYETELPSEVVWVHVALATLTWVGYVHVWAAAGRPAARRVARPAAPSQEREADAERAVVARP
jgi:cytochrome c oxidase assembly protein subunit 15